MLVTIGGFLLAEGSLSPWVAGLILILTIIKGRIIVVHFMELGGRRHILGHAMNLYCPLVAILVWVILFL